MNPEGSSQTPVPPREEAKSGETSAFKPSETDSAASSFGDLVDAPNFRGNEGF